MSHLAEKAWFSSFHECPKDSDLEVRGSTNSGEAVGNTAIVLLLRVEPNELLVCAVKQANIGGSFCTLAIF
jgi:hypothetical protein